MKAECKAALQAGRARGQTDPALGWVARSTAVLQPTWTGIFSTDVELPVEAEFQITVGEGAR